MQRLDRLQVLLVGGCSTQKNGGPGHNMTLWIFVGLVATNNGDINPSPAAVEPTPATRPLSSAIPM